MSRRMSVSMTLDAVRDQTKTVTRRHVDTWKNLRPGDRLTLIEKGMGLPKGAKQVVVCEVEIVAVDVEPITHVELDPWETVREGLPHMTPAEFIQFWLDGHGYGKASAMHVQCRRIEWRYLNDEPVPSPLSRYEDTDGDDGEDAVREQIATGERDERGRIGGEW